MAAPAEALVWLFIFAIFFLLIYAAAYLALFFIMFSFSVCAAMQLAMHKKKLLGHDLRACQGE